MIITREHHAAWCVDLSMWSKMSNINFRNKNTKIHSRSNMDTAIYRSRLTFFSLFFM